jgi:hypothetical protein
MSPSLRAIAAVALASLLTIGSAHALTSFGA